MNKYKITASCVTICDTIIEASSEEEAFKLAKELDGGVFDARLNGEDWNIDHVIKLEAEDYDLR